MNMKKEIDISNLPYHVAIIMDGNGRWAKKRLLNRINGHQEGVKSIRSVVKTARELGIKVLSLYAFSKENWNRPKLEVSALMELLKRFLVSELPEMKKNNIEIRIIGSTEDFSDEIQALFKKSNEETKDGAKMILNLCLSYSGRSDIINAIKDILKENKVHEIPLEKITEDFVSDHLYTSGLKDPDLLIRTSGEMRISNYFLWQIAYSEIYVTEKLWPDFKGDDLNDAILDYQSRERRFGLTSEQVK
ncbi:isoprenyl transferase [Thermodesulfobacteriota bacterium]